MIHVTDPLTRHRFLIDTGAEVSVLPATSADRRRPSQPEHTLRAVNGSSIASFGTRSLTVSLGLRRRFQFVFVIADVEQPIIGADFLHHHRLTVDLQARRIMDSVTQLSSPANIAHVSHFTSPSINLTSVPDSVKNILSSFPDLTRPYTATMPAKHTVEHHLSTKGPPVHARARRLAPDRLAAAKAEFEHMMDMGIIRPSSSSWSSPLHMVRKSSDDWRPCGDSRRFRASVSKVISQPRSLGGRRPVDRAAGAALRLIGFTHVRVYSRATHDDFFSAFKASVQRRDEDWPLLAFLSSSITSTDKTVLKPKKKGHASALSASIAGSSYLSSSRVKNKDRWTTNGIDWTVSVEQTERASSRKA